MTRGFTLYETVVVLAIGAILLLALAPVAVDLLRQERALASPVLGVEGLPFLHERLSRDFALAGVAHVGPFPGSSRFAVELAPLKREDPEVTWEFAFDAVKRTAQRTAKDGTVTSDARGWKLQGQLSLVWGELPMGRYVLLYQPADGEKELLAFALGRPVERGAR